jgi:hypothetical protein
MRRVRKSEFLPLIGNQKTSSIDSTSFRIRVAPKRSIPPQPHSLVRGLAIGSSAADSHRASYCLILALAALIRAANCPLAVFSFPRGMVIGPIAREALHALLARGQPSSCRQAHCNRVPYPNSRPLRSLAERQPEHGQRPWSAPNKAADNLRPHSRLWRPARAF